jgi:cytochrome d ubiquinol oxidase subunit II
MEYVGGFWNLLNPYGLIGGVSAVAVFSLHGGVFLSLKTRNALMERARDFARKLWLPVVVIYLLLVIATFIYVDTSTQFGSIPGIVAILAGLAVLLAGVFRRQKRDGWAFVMTTLTIVLTLATFFLIMYPNVMISSLNPEAWSLTIYNAASSDYTLRVMSIVALIFVPIVLAYQGWTYWIFRKRLTADPAKLEY